MPDTGAPKQAEIDRITIVIMNQLGTVDLTSALTVVCNLAGQLVAAQSDRKPSLVQRYGNLVAENVKRAALAKLIFDDDQRRRQEHQMNGKG
jgi:hypothetical protein